MSFDIIGTGSALPGMSVHNDRLSEFLATSDEWIASRTGIRERRVLADESLLSLASLAAQRALAQAGVAADELDLIICATMSADNIVPSLACQVQQALGARCPAFDLNAACSGFVYALDMAAACFSRQPDKKLLIIGAEAMSRLVDWTDRSSCVLFGDGAGAVVLAKGRGLKAIRLSASGDDQVMGLPGLQGNSPFRQMAPQAPYLRMQGGEVYRFAVNAMVNDLMQVIQQAGLQGEDIDLVLPHQANARILAAAADRLHIPGERFMQNIHNRGNTSAASIPILLDELHHAGSIKPGMYLAMSAFGGGLTTGACVLQWPGEAIGKA